MVECDHSASFGLRLFRCLSYPRLCEFHFHRFITQQYFERLFATRLLWFRLQVICLALIKRPYLFIIVISLICMYYVSFRAMNGTFLITTVRYSHSVAHPQYAVSLVLICGVLYFHTFSISNLIAQIYLIYVLVIVANDRRIMEAQWTSRI